MNTEKSYMDSYQPGTNNSTFFFTINLENLKYSSIYNYYIKPNSTVKLEMRENSVKTCLVQSQTIFF